jgi:hypothetical protein
MRYQIYFRTSRGGIGIPYELAKTEFLTVFHRFELEIEREWWAKHRMWIELSLPPDEIAATVLTSATRKLFSTCVLNRIAMKSFARLDV